MTDVVTAVGELAPGIRARAGEIEKARRLPADLARALARAEAFRMLVPRDVGGLELAPAVALRAIEAAGAADASAGWCVMIGATTGLNAAYLPIDTAREIFGPPEAIAGGVFAPMGKAVRDGEDYVLDGSWQWASGSANCDWLLAGAIVFENGAPRKLPDGGIDDRKFIFPASQAVLNDTWHVTGLCGTGSGEMVVSQVRVPARRTASYLENKPRAAGALYAFPVFGLLALGIAAVALGNARSAIEDLVELAGGKQPQGSRRTLAERGSAQTALAVAEADLRSARAFFYETVEQAWQVAQDTGQVDVRQRALLRLAATNATRKSADVTRAMYDLAGGSSVFLSSPLQRRFRDAHVATQHLMISPPTYELAGRVLMGLPIDPATPL
ncbi:MAG: acyl-CoA dehydrogenase family protein [Rhodospirillales bacterium]